MFKYNIWFAVRCFFLALAILVFPPTVFARVALTGGQIGLGYQEYTKKEDGRQVAHSDVFSQKYSVSSAIWGNLYNQRSGPYSLLMRYEHRDYSTEVNGRKYSPSKGAFSWDGKMGLHMPHLQNLELSIFAKNEELITEESESYDTGVIIVRPPAMLIKGSSAFRGFNASLGQEERLKYYVGYSNLKEEYKSYGGLYENGNISLQSGVNWFHYLLNDTADSSGGNKVKSRTIVIGNIGLGGGKNQAGAKRSGVTLGSREWFRLTNWIRTSSDARYNSTKSGNGGVKSTGEGINVYMNGNRLKWKMDTSVNYRASQTASRTGRSINMPLYLAFRPVHGSSIYSTSRYGKGYDKSASVVTNSDAVQQTLRWVYEPHRSLRLEPNYSFVRSRSSNGNEDITHRLNFNAYKTGDQIDYRFGSQYSIASTEAPAVQELDSRSYIISGGFVYRYSPKGQIDFDHNYANSSDNRGSYSEAHSTTVRGSYNISRTSDVDLSLQRDASSNSDGVESETIEMDGTYQYRGLRMQTRFDLDYSDSESTNTGGIQAVSTSSRSYGIRNTTTYSISRSLKSMTVAGLDEQRDDGSRSRRENFSEQLDYAYYRGMFSKRRLFDLTGRFTYDANKGGGNRARIFTYSGNINYYMTYYFSLGGGYSYTDSETSSSTGMSAYFSFSFPRLVFNCRYDVSTEDQESGKKEEDRLSLDLTKYF